MPSVKALGLFASRELDFLSSRARLMGPSHPPSHFLMLLFVFYYYFILIQYFGFTNNLLPGSEIL